MANMLTLFLDKSAADEIKFGSFDELKNQIQKDVEKSQGYFLQPSQSFRTLASMKAALQQKKE